MPPYLLLLVLLGAIYGTLFHLVWGKTVRDFIIYFLTGIIGVSLGQAIGNLLDATILMVGPLHLIEATLVGWISLFVMHWLKLRPPQQQGGK